MAKAEILTDKMGRQSSKTKPEYVVDEFDGKTVRCADRTIWKYDAKAKLWRREYTVGHADYLRYNGGVTKPKRNLPDEVYERTAEHKAAITAADEARKTFYRVQKEEYEALKKLGGSRTNPQKAARIKAALEARLDEARNELVEAVLAESKHSRNRKRRIKAAEQQQMAAAMERNRQRQERSQAARRAEGVAEMHELLGSK